jgi:hypothetical protein
MKFFHPWLSFFQTQEKSGAAEQPLFFAQKNATMKKKILEALYSFLLLLFFACALAGAVLLSMLLLPFAAIAIAVIAIKEMLTWSKKSKQAKKGNEAASHRETAAVITMHQNSRSQKVA